MEVTIKISQFPTDVQAVANGWKQFVVDADGREISITVQAQSIRQAGRGAEELSAMGGSDHRQDRRSYAQRLCAVGAKHPGIREEAQAAGSRGQACCASI